MALIEKELGIAAIATAVAMSPRAREAAREGAVYTLASAMKAADILAGASRGAYAGARSGLSDADQPPGGSARENGEDSRGST